MPEESMSENLELVRSIHKAWGCGDFGSAGWAHAEIEYILADGFGGAWVGRQGMSRRSTLFHLRDQLVRRIVQYYDRDRALADVGLQE